jgi:23S rRNA (uridine2552-2'-O)-methyltransferase
MSKPRGSGRSWRERQEKDPYVQRARRDGWRSRAVYKLEELDDKERLLRPGMTCVDLGAAPGSWSQYVTRKLDGNARIIAIDLLPMDSLPNTAFIQGDFTEDAALQELEALVGEQKVDLVMSDLAPNISGNRVIDQPRAMYLAELALDFARDVLAERGDFVIKLFQGAGIDPYIADVRKSFATVKVRKPKASRAGSREVYLVARNYRL